MVRGFPYMLTHCNTKKCKVGKVLSSAEAVMKRRKQWRVNDVQ
jgi:hypothetical protein